MERSTCKLLFHRGGVTIRFIFSKGSAGSIPVTRTTLKAFIDAALSVFLSRFSTEMTDINKADSKRIRLFVNSWGKELK